MVILKRIHRIFSSIRQFTYPREFRIYLEPDWNLLDVLTTLNDSFGNEKKDTQIVHSPSPSTMDKQELIIELCNQYFRLVRSFRRLKEENEQTRDIKNMSRSIESISRVLEDHGVQCIDLSGQVYDHGRNDFLPLGEPDVESGIEQMKIKLCDTPLILVHDKIVQVAKGTVVRPSGSQE